MKRWVFKSFLKTDRDAAVLVALGRSFHHLGTTHENSLDCLKRGEGFARQQSIDDQSDRVVT